MVKTTSKWVCQQCGYESVGYLGKCPSCSAWGSFLEETSTKGNDFNSAANEFLNNDKPQLLDDIKINETFRIPTHISEFDRILGGGLAEGSLILIAGDPGIGKSTLTLQTCGQLATTGKKILYVSAEESSNQVKSRADRLEIKTDNIYIYPQTNMENIKTQIEELEPDIIVIDSIQAIYSNNVESTAGSVSQIRECCNILMHIAKSKNITTIVIGHVTKDGNIAGPKVLEHIVDTVIYFEGDKYKSYRLLRPIKNRFGDTCEVGIFEMSENGLKCVTNPNEL